MFRGLLAVCFLFYLNFTNSKSECDFPRTDISSIVRSKTPRSDFQVTYPNALVTCGNNITTLQAAKAPSVQYAADDKSFYTLMMLDPDAPFPEKPTASNWLHWLVVNIPGSKIDQGQVLADYNPPSPPRSSGPHRYVFGIFRQKEAIANASAITAPKRPNFQIADWKTTLKLETMEATDFFYARSL